MTKFRISYEVERYYNNIDNYSISEIYTTGTISGDSIPQVIKNTITFMSNKTYTTERESSVKDYGDEYLKISFSDIEEIVAEHNFDYDEICEKYPEYFV